MPHTSLARHASCTGATTCSHASSVEGAGLDAGAEAGLGWSARRGPWKRLSQGEGEEELLRGEVVCFSCPGAASQAARAAEEEEELLLGFSISTAPVVVWQQEAQGLGSQSPGDQLSWNGRNTSVQLSAPVAVSAAVSMATAAGVMSQSSSSSDWAGTMLKSDSSIFSMEKEELPVLPLLLVRSRLHEDDFLSRDLTWPSFGGASQSWGFLLD
ncbi:hypothetical protein CRUP_017119 [Coryphaenoides rupestris]|nr:hypothetical protein CRUP_017119 [Coryphaenoides rupestris]